MGRLPANLPASHKATPFGSVERVCQSHVFQGRWLHRSPEGPMDGRAGGAVGQVGLEVAAMADGGTLWSANGCPYFDLTCSPLPDVIELVEFYACNLDEPSGALSYALRLFHEIDLDELQTIYEDCDVSFVRDPRHQAYAVTYDHARVTSRQALVLQQAETVVNRLVRVFGNERQSPRLRLSEQACSNLDFESFQHVTEVVPSILEAGREEGRWACPGSTHCSVGGEWDVRTRIATACESFSPIVRLDYRFNVDVAAGRAAIEFIAPHESFMPHSECRDIGQVEPFLQWCSIDVDERARMAREYAARAALVFASAAFASGGAIRRCSIEALDAMDRRAVATWEFERGHFLSVYATFARTLVHQPLSAGTCSSALRFEEGTRILPDAREDARWVRPAEDDRPLPQGLRDLLMAGSMRELDATEPDTGVDMQRFEYLYMLIWIDPPRAIHELRTFVSRLEARCAARELESLEPVRFQHCESQMERILLPLAEPDRSVRIERAPDALFYAQSELARLYMGMGEYELALDEAECLIDLAPVSSEAYFILVNSLARLERYEDVIEVCKRGLRVAYGRTSASYFYYRMAFAYWNVGCLDEALACYGMVSSGEQISESAHEEMDVLIKRAGYEKPFEPDEAETVLQRAGVSMPLTDEVHDQIADAAVLLCDNGFFWLAQACAEYLQNVTGDADLEAVAQSFHPHA